MPSQEIPILTEKGECMPRKKKKNISTLVDDIFNLIDIGVEEIDKDNLKDFLDTLKEETIRFLKPSEGEKKRLRLSAVGRHDRQLWFEINDPVKRKEIPQLRMRFFYGHLLEALLLFLAKEAGHDVKHQQKEVVLEGVKGHIDAVIDGVLVDVKSASDYGFKKFQTGGVFHSDPFGYIGQISSYMEAMDLEEGGFFVINKNSGNMTLMMMDELSTINAAKRVSDLKEIVKSDKIPEKCYEDVPFGTSGNRTLQNGCVFCNYKEKCWADSNDGDGLRVFTYANGPRYFTEVQKEPNVAEVM